MNNFKNHSLRGFTLIELMITVAIIGVLAAVAIPVYQSYIRRSHLSEATSSISAIKSAQESYFTINGCYVEAEPNPSSIPQGSTLPWNTNGLGWGRNALSVRPDRRVRFQYTVYATNSIGCNAPTQDLAVLNAAIPAACVGTPRVGASGVLVDTAFHTDHWYVVLVQGDQDADGDNSVMVSAIDDSLIFQCDELE